MGTGIPLTFSFEGTVAAIAWDMVKSVDSPQAIADPQKQADWYQAEFLRVYTELLPKSQAIAGQTPKPKVIDS